jgi:hypothetical protein
MQLLLLITGSRIMYKKYSTNLILVMLYSGINVKIVLCYTRSGGENVNIYLSSLMMKVPDNVYVLG